MNAVTAVMGALGDAESTWHLLANAANSGVFEAMPEAREEAESLDVTRVMQQPQRLQTIPLLWVSAEMVDLLEHAARTLPAQRFNPDSLPWPEAFVVLARPIQTGDTPISAITWGAPPMPQTIADPATHVVAGLVRTGRVMAIVLWAKVGAGSLIGELRSDGRHDDPDGWARILSALWLLVQQKVAVRKVTHPARADVRRWGREHDRPIPEVTVIELRRPLQTSPHEDTPQADVDWSHRWIVDGHWRNQWHPRLNAHVPTWIAPHVKGPEDKPLVVKRRVNAWVR